MPIIVSSSQHSESKSLIDAAVTATALVIVIVVPAAQISATAAASAVSAAINLTCTCTSELSPRRLVMIFAVLLRLISHAWISFVDTIIDVLLLELSCHTFEIKEITQVNLFMVIWCIERWNIVAIHCTHRTEVSDIIPKGILTRIHPTPYYIQLTDRLSDRTFMYEQPCIIVFEARTMFSCRSLQP